MKKREKCMIVITILIVIGVLIGFIVINNMKNENNLLGNEEKIVTVKELGDILEVDPDYKINSVLQKDAKDGEYEKLFDKTKIQDVKIIIDESNWEYLIDNAIEKPTVLTTKVSIGDNEIKYAGIKTKGQKTLRAVWDDEGERYSFTLNFGKYINKNNGYDKKQNFYGLSKVALNNMYEDATLMKEYLSYELLTEMGIPTPFYCLVNLYINNEFFGVYMMVESIDDALTERTLKEKSDFLVKPEAPGGNLYYRSILDQYINEEGEFDFSSILYDENGKLVYPYDLVNVLNPYNGLWENDKDTFEEVVEKLPAVFKWMKKLNELNDFEEPNSEEYKEKVEELMIDVDNVIRYFAVNTYLVNLDSYVSIYSHNYVFYLNDEGKAAILPWDYNLSFGALGGYNAFKMINYDIYNPTYHVKIERLPLLNIILQNDEYKKKYETYLNDACIIATEGGTTSFNREFEKNNFVKILEDYNVRLKNTYSKDPTAFYTYEEYEDATNVFKKIIVQRSTAVLQQLAGNKTEIEQVDDIRILWL